MYDRLGDLDPSIVTDLLMSFDPVCKSNVEFMQWANEILFEVIRREPAITTRSFMVRSEFHQAQIINALSNPINDEIDLDKVLLSLRSVDGEAERRYRDMMIEAVLLAKKRSSHINGVPPRDG